MKTWQFCILLMACILAPDLGPSWKPALIIALAVIASISAI